MIPIADENPRGFLPFINYTLLVINIVVYFFLQQNTDVFFAAYALIPSQLVNQPFESSEVISIFTSMFLHGGLMHLLGNMLYLWIFGDNIEYLVGHIRYLLFYLITGLGAAAAQILTDPVSSIPMIGASGAISGVLGAYLIKFPGNRISILLLIPFFVQIIRVPALIVLGFWFLLQLANGFSNMGSQTGGGVAWFAHIGGFIAGIILIKLIFAPKSRR